MAEPTVVVQQIEEAWTQADLARYNVKRQWDTNWNIYRGVYDFSRKAPWQSQVPVNKLAAEVRFAANELTKAVEIAGRYFVFDAHGDAAQESARASELLTRYRLDARETALRAKIAEASRAAMICGHCIFKLYWRDDTLQFETVDPYDWWIDPTGRGRYCIHRTVLDHDQIMEMAEQDGGFDREVAEQLSGDDGSVEEAERRVRADLSTSPTPKGRRPSEIWEYWGDLIGPDGKLIVRNGWAVVAERKWLLRAPEENPFRHGRWPFVVAAPERDPFAPYGDPLMKDVAQLAVLLTSLVNLAADAAMIDGIPIWQVNRLAMRFPEQALGPLYPGKVFEAQTSDDIVKAVQKGYSGAQVTLPVLDRVDTLIQNTTGLTQFLTGATGTGPRRTATEVVYKGRQSGHLLESLAAVFQDALAAIAEMTRDLIAQFQPRASYLEEPFRGLLGERTAGLLYSMSDEQRYAYLCTQHSVRGRGVAAIFTRQEELNRVLQFLQLAEIAPEIRDRVDMNELLRKAIQSFGWEPEDVLLSEEEIAQRQQMRMMQMMQQQQAQAPEQQQPALRGASQGGVPWQGPLERPTNLRIPAVA